MFYAQHTYAKIIYPIEPNHRSRHLLETNIRANLATRAKIAMDHLGVAAGAKTGNVKILDGSINNLGAAKVVDAPVVEGGTVPIRPLDNFEIEGTISFIKIDVEGMELEVLAGAKLLLHKHRPAIAIEVLDKNDKQLWEWAKSEKYKIIGSFVEYQRFKNYILIPAY